MVLLGLAVAFPLANSIQMAFKRREKALEYLALFKSALLTIHYSFRMSKKLDAEKKAESTTILNGVCDTLLQLLKTSNGNMSNVKAETDKVMQFIERNREEISARILIRVIRYLKDTLDGATYLVSLTAHRTILGLRLLAIFSIVLFSALHPLMMVYLLKDQMPEWTVYLCCIFGPLLLITLYNVQAHLEYPFDQKGADDIKLDEFKLNI